MTTVYGIKNCSTMKKAFDWLDGQGVTYDFHDYKKAGITRDRLAAWAERLGWQTLLNTRGTTWRKLPPELQADMDLSKALDLMLAQPSLVKRPILDTGSQLLAGFDAHAYTTALTVMALETLQA